MTDAFDGGKSPEPEEQQGASAETSQPQGPASSLPSDDDLFRDLGTEHVPGENYWATEARVAKKWAQTYSEFGLSKPTASPQTPS
jgi:hypothetical protein